MGPPTVYVYRDAITGRLVTKEYAKAHPETTVRETVVREMPPISPDHTRQYQPRNKENER